MIAGLLVLCGLVYAVRPESTLRVTVLAAVLGGFLRLPVRYLVCLVIAYLPFQEFLLSKVPPGDLLFVRFMPEVVVWAIALGVAFSRLELLRTRARLVFPPVALCAAFWIATALWNEASLTTTVIGLRAQFRFLPLAAIALASIRPKEDIRLYARLLALLASAQALLGLVQFIGGETVRSWFVSKWTIVVDGVVFAESTAAGVESVFGTFSDKNTYADFLVFAWIVAVAAGRRGLGLPRGAGIAVGTLIALAVLVSGSREAGIAMLLAGLVIVRVRFRFPSARVAAVAGVLVFAALAAAALHTRSSSDATRVPQDNLDSLVITERWKSLLTREAWSTESNGRLGLLSENGKLVADEAPVFGFGIGSVTDRRKFEDGTNPFFRTMTGTFFALVGYEYDSNWALLLAEVGFGGLIVLALLLVALGRTGVHVMRYHWAGLALLGVLIAVVVVGFMTAVLMLRLPNAVLWLLAGTVGALAGEEADASRSRS